jgi:hypothetical protein
MFPVALNKQFICGMVLGQILTRYTPFKEKKSNVIEGGM